MRRALALCILSACAVPPAPAAPRFFKITVVDRATGRGVPLIELITTHSVRYVTDSAGVVAFDVPGGRVWFTVKGHGYAHKKDGFGFEGVALDTVAGGAARIELDRVNIAERLYRITGKGIYRDTVLCGGVPPVPEHANEAVGMDSTQRVIFQGRVLWFWGDTNKASYPLGNFHMTGAWTGLDEDPEVGIRLNYFTKDGFVRGMFPSDAPGPVWCDGLTVVEDRLFCHYARMKSLGEMYEHGIGEWDEKTEEFRKVKELPLDEKRHPSGHPVLHDGWWTFGASTRTMRVRANVEALLDPAAYESIPPVTELKELGTARAVKLHNGSVSWNAHRRKWILIANESWGTSMVGEVWYAEAARLEGPWSGARKIVTHDDYSFYNVVEHPFLAKGRYVYFEGTYTASFSGTKVPTPRYDYNQVMYRLDLDDPRLRH